MSSRNLRSRICSVDSRAGSTQGNLEEGSLTDFSQEGGIITTEIRDWNYVLYLDNTSDDNAIINLSSSDQTNNISQDQLKDSLNTVMQAIRTESAKQTAESAKKISALHEEFKKNKLQLC